MDVLDVQRLLKQAGYQPGLLDGDFGPQTYHAVKSVEAEHSSSYNGDPKNWSRHRRLIASAQVVLNRSGHLRGMVDGYAGRQTVTALVRWKADNISIPTEVSDFASGSIGRPIRKREIYRKLGRPGRRICRSGCVRPPFILREDWGKRRPVRSFACHARLEGTFNAVFQDIFEHYGRDAIEDLGINRFGGCYNPRRIRGGRSWSIHAWGSALDLFPSRNGLFQKSTPRVRCGIEYSAAVFASAPYDALHQIMEYHGLRNLGRERDYDWMHWQAVEI